MTPLEQALKVLNDTLNLQAGEHVFGGELILWIPDPEEPGLRKTYLSPAEVRTLGEAIITIANTMRQVQTYPKK